MTHKVNTYRGGCSRAPGDGTGRIAGVTLQRVKAKLGQIDAFRLDPLAQDGQVVAVEEGVAGEGGHG